jgi:hypothetical protein
MPEAERLINNESCFVLHAPRQSGKTTFLDSLTYEINDSDKYYALNCSLATLRSIDNENDVLARIVSRINMAMRASEIDAIKQRAYRYDSLPGMTAPDSKVQILLNQLCLELDRDLVVFFDEADCLSGPGLLTFLAQIREGHDLRHKPGCKFPVSLALAGMRDIVDRLARVRPEHGSARLAGPFTFCADSLTLADFTLAEVQALYRQHTEATGQVFEAGAAERAWHWSEGQPWLVNALAGRIVEKELGGAHSSAITAGHVDRAAEALIRRRGVHLDHLLERLKEPRVIRVMDRVLAGTNLSTTASDDDDVKYCVDLGLVASDEWGRLRPANRVYRDAMVGFLTSGISKLLPAPSRGDRAGGGRLMSDLIGDFRRLWRDPAASLTSRRPDNLAVKYGEAAPALILYAFMAKALAGSGTRLQARYAEGRGRMDISVFHQGAEYPVGVEAADNDQPFCQEEGLARLVECLLAGGAKEGWLLVFDQDREKPWAERDFWRKQTRDGLTIHVVGC